MVGTNEAIYSKNCRDFVFGDLDENIKTKISRIEHLANLRRRDGPTGTNLSQSFFKSSHFFGTCFHDGRGVNGSENRVRFCKRHAFHTMKDKLRRSLRVVQKKMEKVCPPPTLGQTSFAPARIFHTTAPFHPVHVPRRTKKTNRFLPMTRR
jgi:hypothetical protein